MTLVVTKEALHKHAQVIKPVLMEAVFQLLATPTQTVEPMESPEALSVLATVCTKTSGPTLVTTQELLTLNVLTPSLSNFKILAMVTKPVPTEAVLM